jgi:hypothetical protein
MCPTVNGKNYKFHYNPKCQISQKFVHQLKLLYEDIPRGTMNVKRHIFAHVYSKHATQ